MNRTNWQHALIGAVMMLVAWAILALIGVSGAALIALVIPVTWFISRECTSHEYRLGVARGWRWGKKLPVRWWEGIARGWTRDSMLDWVTPALVCLLLLYAIQLGIGAFLS